MFSIPLFLLSAISATLADSAKTALPYRHHGLTERQIGFYAVYPPKAFAADSAKGKRYPLCVILHGSGSTEIGHGSLAEDYSVQDILFLSVRAPYADHEAFLESRMPGYTAWPEVPEEWGKFGEPGYPAGEPAQAEARALYVEWIADCIRDVRRRYPVDTSRAVVVGHSQGAGFAREFATAHPEMAKAFLAYAGRHSKPAPGDTTMADAFARGKVLPVIVHCEGDSVVPVQGSRDLIRYLKDHKVPVQGAILPGGDHSISTRPNLAIREFLYRQCLGKAPIPLQGRLLISSVLPGSRADSLGLRKGDRFLKFDGKPIRSMDDFLAARVAAKVKAKAKAGFEVEREGKVLVFSTPPGMLGIKTEER